ncbi:uncharacterized protein LOC125517476 isoform X1 [Triticum urartu]|nr:uncharacterized protein LOC125517476 isoform X1 [Triticum urartu]XP_048538630.1 uncharacterized protein LOC125517476 isoform X1 [Triticum urartu]XP_048538631.1 uncharacterized protein LOC125517476 isoform X1 [Triticum urartu]XP_048538632.1 uncharacterized protein LOC125517476 isoform X1 [Triticum urartu]XP_048538633.1 uncharacterized protein LOC125517476 isoform X1 [Triticum urartu]XP_048538634.1 uncharacterized protein LOC125517476 isoform X1 [Triticum urartu]XP_048538635.1 uncharacterize
MLRLRRCVLAQLLSSPSASTISPLLRLLSAAAPAVSPNPSFAVEDYLVATCGLSRAQALKASPKLSHLKSPAKPDAVLSFLDGHGFSSSDVAAVVAGDPKVLCSSVEGYLGPVVAQLTGLGLSRSQIARLISYCHGNLHLTSIVSKLQYYLPLFGSIDNTLLALKRCLYLISSDLERVVKPNVAALRDSGLGDCDIAKLCVPSPRLLTTNVESIRAMVSCAESLGVPRGSRMFRHAMSAVVFLGEEKIAAKLGYLKKTFRWSDAEAGIAVSKYPILLRRSKDSLRSRSEFLISEVGLEPAYIAHRPLLLSYSLEGRLRPRYYVVKFLKENGLLHRGRDYYSAVAVTPKVFMEKFICPHMEAAPHLAEDYAEACRGEVPTRFRFT